MTPTQWADYFHRAAKEELGIAITFNEPVSYDTLCNQIHHSRPPGFGDYTITQPSIPNTIFIVKPGVTLD